LISEDDDMATVGSSEAKRMLSALLERVELGEQIVIIRHGRPIARLMPIESGRAGSVSPAMAKLRKLRQGATLGRPRWKELRDAGRKY
jgi:prevent-host-death family protein